MYTTKSATEKVKTFVERHWSDQKLVEVQKFCREGKMDYMSTCGCLLGVTLARTMHCGIRTSGSQRYYTGEAFPCPDGNHYDRAIHLSGAGDAECAYMSEEFGPSQNHRDFRLAKIICEVMAERGAAKVGELEPEAELVGA